MRAVRSKAAYGPQDFAMPGLWRVFGNLVFAVVALHNSASQAADAIVTIHPDAHHQTIKGWSGIAWYPKVAPEVRDEVLDEVVSDLGLTWLHWEVPSGNRSDGRGWEWTNDDGDLWPFVGMIGYHLYGGPARNTDRPRIRDFALAKGLPISHAGSDGINLDTLHDDLTLGDVSYWSIVGICGPGPGGAFDIHLDNTSFSRSGHYWQYRQVMHYVRPGAVRIECVCDVPAVRPLAFVHRGRTTMVLLNNTPSPQPRSATLRNLPPGDYGVCQCVGVGPYEELGVRRVRADGILDINLPADSVLTIYPHQGKNQPPTVVAWKAEPYFLKTPASRVRLSAMAQDPDLDRLSYSWSVTGQPPGAKAMLADPQSARPSASGLTVPGCYVFTETIRDSVNEVKRDVRLNVYAGNQPPMLFDLHNRLPVQVILPQSETVLRGGTMDLEGDKLTYHWSVVSQPPGSAVRLETPNEGSCRVSNITLPGDHVFKFETSDGTTTVSDSLTVTVYPSAR